MPSSTNCVRAFKDSNGDGIGDFPGLIQKLSRFAPPVDLDLSKVEGMTPVEMLGYVESPPIERYPYRLRLAS
jgi:hypothetical protein